MTLEERVNWQRIVYIVENYELVGTDGETFNTDLAEMISSHAMPIIELAFAETILDVWTVVPLPRGVLFLEHANNILKAWRENGFSGRLTPSDFKQITGLDPAPIIHALRSPTSQAPVL